MEDAVKKMSRTTTALRPWPVSAAAYRSAGTTRRTLIVLGTRLVRCYVGGWLELNSIPEFGTDACASLVGLSYGAGTCT